MTPTLALFAYLLGAAIVFGFGYLWYRTSPALGSGWALFAAIFIAISVHSPTNQVVGVVIYAVLTAGFGVGWYLARSKEHSGWLLFAAILGAFSFMNYLL